MEFVEGERGDCARVRVERRRVIMVGINIVGVLPKSGDAVRED